MASSIGAPPIKYPRGYSAETHHRKPDKCLKCDSKVLTKTGSGATEALCVGPPDKDGNHHDHDDANVYCVGYKCDKGHELTVAGYFVCWCGWSSEDGGPKPTYEPLPGWKLSGGFLPDIKEPELSDKKCVSCKQSIPSGAVTKHCADCHGILCGAKCIASAIPRYGCIWCSDCA